VAALAAGLALVNQPFTVLLAADLPFVSAVHVRSLLQPLQDHWADPVDGVMYVDRNGRDQPLVSAWRTVRLRAVLPEAPAGCSLRRVLARLRVQRLLAHDDLIDCDTPAELEAARIRAGSDEGDERR
jgi:molybdopterin-guanine dinucleotide biosynthesis protein A